MDNNKIIYKFDKVENIWFTSDTHFHHDNIIKFCNRPFENVEEMNETLITNWNNNVKKDDIVFHLGDFAFCGSKEYNEVLNSLNGNIYLILGNHDLRNIKQGYINRFKYVGQQMMIEMEKQKIYLNHYPFLCYSGVYRGTNAVWQLFGHVHSGPRTKTGLDCQRLINLFPTQYDVGVDNNNFNPVSFNKVKEIISNQMLSLNMYRGGE